MAWLNRWCSCRWPYRHDCGKILKQDGAFTWLSENLPLRSTVIVIDVSVASFFTGRGSCATNFSTSVCFFISATLAASLARCFSWMCKVLVERMIDSASFSAEMSVRSPRKLFIFIIKRKHCLAQSIQKIFDLILKREALKIDRRQQHDRLLKISFNCSRAPTSDGTGSRNQWFLFKNQIK